MPPPSWKTETRKDWLRGENGMDGPGCIARMDELQTAYLNNSPKEREGLPS